MLRLRVDRLFCMWIRCGGIKVEFVCVLCCVGGLMLMLELRLDRIVCGLVWR